MCLFDSVVEMCKKWNTRRPTVLTSVLFFILLSFVPSTVKLYPASNAAFVQKEREGLTDAERDAFALEETNRTLVLFSYFEPRGDTSSGESNTDKLTAKRNLEFFVKHGVLGPYAPSSTEATFVFIINGGHLSIKLPEELSHVHLFRRENSGLDLCGYSQALERYKEDSHHFFVFLNSSVRGPYLPNYVPLSLSWNHLFENLISESVKLVGVSVNCLCCQTKQEWCKSCSEKDGLDQVHLQSFVFVTDNTGLQVIRPALGCYNSRQEVIVHGEIGLSRQIRLAGHNLASLDKFWYHHDFQNVSRTRQMCESVARMAAPFQGDTQFEGAYFGMDHHPAESIFIKINRGETRMHKLYTRWSDESEERTECKADKDEDQC